MLVLVELIPESRPRIVSKTLEQKVGGHFICGNHEINLQKKLQKVVQLANFAIFFKFRCLLISSKAQQASHAFQY